MRFLAVVIAVLALACSKDPTDVTMDAIRAHRTLWQNQMLTTYHFDYVVTGSLISWAGKTIRVDVQGSAVQSATMVENGQPMPDPATNFPTIEALFERAEAAARARTLALITFDETRGFPSYLSVGGPAEAQESITISNLAGTP